MLLPSLLNLSHKVKENEKTIDSLLENQFANPVNSIAPIPLPKRVLLVGFQSARKNEPQISEEKIESGSCVVSRYVRTIRLSIVLASIFRILV